MERYILLNAVQMSGVPDYVGTSNIDEEDRIERGTDTFANLVSFPKPDLISVRLWEKV